MGTWNDAYEELRDLQDSGATTEEVETHAAGLLDDLLSNDDD